MYLNIYLESKTAMVFRKQLMNFRKLKLLKQTDYDVLTMITTDRVKQYDKVHYNRLSINSSAVIFIQFLKHWADNNT